MTGQLLGVFVKNVINSLLAGQLLFPEFKARVDEMEDNQWYDWDEYVEMVQTIQTKLAPVVMTKIGTEIIYSGKQQFYDLGYNTIDDILQNYTTFFAQVVKDLPDEQNAKLVSFEPGHCVMTYGKDQPQALLEGIIKGLFKSYDARPLKIDISDNDVHSFKVDIKY